MLDTILHALQLGEATVTSTTDSGDIHVYLGDGAKAACRMLETSVGPPLALAEGDRVLVVMPPESRSGYVLGRIARPIPTLPSVSEPANGRAVEIVVPENVETVRISGRKITIAADDVLVLECGGGSVRIDRRGNVVVLGTDITTRAKRNHKLKGARVAIN